MKLFIIFFLIIFLQAYTFADRNTSEHEGPVIAVLPKGECGEWWKLKTLLPLGFGGMVEIKDEAEARDGQFWGILRISCTKSEFRTTWTFRHAEVDERANIWLHPRDKFFTTNWENLEVRGYKRPGSSNQMWDWDIKEKWARVPKLKITIDTSDIKTLITILKDYGGAVRSLALEKLQRITEQNFGEDYKKWDDWWEKNRPR